MSVPGRTQGGPAAKNWPEDDTVWREKLVTSEGKPRTLREVIAVYRVLGVHIECERKPVPLHSLIGTQDAIEADRYELVRQLLGDGKLG